MTANSIANLYNIKIAGVTFGNRQNVCKQLNIGDIIQLEREPSNPYDSNAIRVLYKGQPFGYIPKEIAQNIAHLIGSNFAYHQVTVTNLTGGGSYNTGVVVDIVFFENKDDKGESNHIHYDDFGFGFDHIPTEEQKKIIEYNLRPIETIKVIAFAGTGKTTTLLDYTKVHKNKRFLYIAFNSSVQRSANKKFPYNVHCRTSHSLAFEKFGWQYKNGKGIVNTIKLNEIKDVLRLEDYGVVNRVFVIFNKFLSSSEDTFSTQLLNKNPSDVSDVDYQHLAIAKQLWEKMIDSSDKSIGMLHDGYLKLFQLSKPILDYDCILLDEAQDTNPVVTDIVVRQQCAKILVGDSHQQIYSFRGAVDAIAKIQASTTFYLTKSFRFGPEIAWLANKILRLYKDEHVELIGGKEKEEVGIKAKKTFGIISRTNAMVFDQAISNSDKRIAFLGGFDGYHFNDIMDVYNLYRGNINEIRNPYFRYNFRGYKQMQEYAIEVDDLELKSKCKVVEKYTHSIPSYIEKIKSSVVEEQKADLILCTAHKAKGAQFDIVKICDDFPSFFDKDTTDSIELELISNDETNLLYVTVTRAKERIEFSDSLGWNKFLQYKEENLSNDIINFFRKSNIVSKIEAAAAAAAAGDDDDPLADINKKNTSGQYHRLQRNLETPDQDDDAYTITLEKPNFLNWKIFNNRKNSNNCVISTRIYMTERSGNNSACGIVFSYKNDEFYYVMISVNGFYKIGQKKLEQNYDLIDWQYSPYIKIGQVNFLHLFIQHNKITSYINGFVLDSITLKSLRTGNVGYICQNHDYNYVEAKFNNFRISSPEEEISFIQQSDNKKFFSGNPTLEIDHKGDFILYENGVVEDKSTGLEWCKAYEVPFSWDNAVEWTKNLSLSGGDWHLPKDEELLNISKKCCGWSKGANLPYFLLHSGWGIWTNRSNGPLGAIIVNCNHHSICCTGRTGNYRTFAVRVIDSAWF